MKRIENVNDLMEIGIQNHLIDTVIDERLLYDGNVMLDITQNQKMIRHE
jgi:hypothetical protein